MKTYLHSDFTFQSFLLIFSDSFSVKICVLMLHWRGAMRYSSTRDANKANSCSLFFSQFCLHEIHIAWTYFKKGANPAIPDHRNKWSFFLVSLKWLNYLLYYIKEKYANLTQKKKRWKGSGCSQVILTWSVMITLMLHWKSLPFMPLGISTTVLD